METFLFKLRKDVGAGKEKEVIEKLLDLATKGHPKFTNEILLLSKRREEVQHKERLGVLSQEEAREKIKISAAILSLIDEMDKDQGIKNYLFEQVVDSGKVAFYAQDFEKALDLLTEAITYKVDPEVFSMLNTCREALGLSPIAKEQIGSAPDKVQAAPLSSLPKNKREIPVKAILFAVAAVAVIAFGVFAMINIIGSGKSTDNGKNSDNTERTETGRAEGANGEINIEEPADIERRTDTSGRTDIAENGENRHEEYVEAPKPDLVVRGLQIIPDPAIQGAPITIRVAIKNQGEKRAGPFRVAWWADANSPSTSCVENIAGLEAGVTETITMSYRGYNRPYEQITTKAIVDFVREAEESNENNNERRFSLSVKARPETPPPPTTHVFESPARPAPPSNLPDLSITSFILTPATPKVGEKVEIKVTIKNSGGRAPGLFLVSWWADASQSQPTKGRSVSGLDAGATTTISLEYDGYREANNRLRTKVQIDPRNQITESNDRNNEKAIYIQVKSAAPPPPTVIRH
ncbi:MAG: hypothetical protein KDD01_10605 [Phaeodactylibacter sp.]|nr:hypothetical protein [Phaeodactylibacter sp.]MCB9304603.1 hypothetical protein [Lewinellaceae bacterium]